MIRELDITSREQIQQITRLASEAPYEIWLHSGTIMLDARSFLGLYRLLGKRVSVVTNDDVNPKHFDKLVSKMKLSYT